MQPLSAGVGKRDLAGCGLHHSLGEDMLLPAQELITALSVHSAVGWNEMRMSTWQGRRGIWSTAPVGGHLGFITHQQKCSDNTAPKILLVVVLTVLG